MKILVFDDKEINLKAAKAQLVGHDVTVVSTYDEAQGLLCPRLDQNRQLEIFAEKYGDKDYAKRDGLSDEERSARIDYYYGEARDKALIYPDFDVVLTDLLVPASFQHQGRGMGLAGEEMPVGVFIGLLAAAKGKARYVAVFTDSNHHEHPASACFDVFNKGESDPTPFTVNGCKFILCNCRNWVETFKSDDLVNPLSFSDFEGSYNEFRKQPGVVNAKHWAALLKNLLK